jgi:hypothetical protein
MRSLLAGLVMLLFCGLQYGEAGELRIIEMTDGSTLTAEVLSLANGVYTVRSESLGTLTLDEKKVRSLRSPEAGRSAASGGSSGDIQALQHKMMSDSEIMGLIQSLQNDPEFRKVLEDPEVMKAVQAGDIGALTANPKFMRLLDNATVREIQTKVK